MKLIYIFILSAIIPLSGAGQTSQVITLPADFHHCLEISGLAFKGDTFFMVAEKCTKIYTWKENSASAQSFYINDIPANAELEGIAVRDNFLFLSNEDNGTVYAYDLSKKTSTQVQILGIETGGFSGRHGFEGIAFDKSGHYLFLAQERDGKGSSFFFVFQITQKAKQFTLKLKSQVEIKHNSDDYRYSDIFFDTVSGMLFGLRSYKNDKDNIVKYYIDQFEIKVDKNGVPQPAVADYKSMDITSAFDGLNKQENSTNLEGIIVKNGFVYIISDNYENPNNEMCRASCQENTVLIKVKL